MVIYTLECHFDYVQNASLQQLIKVNVTACLLFNYFSSLFETVHVSFFVFSVVVVVLLHCVVREMDEWLVYAFLT